MHTTSVVTRENLQACKVAFKRNKCNCLRKRTDTQLHRLWISRDAHSHNLCAFLDIHSLSNWVSVLFLRQCYYQCQDSENFTFHIKQYYLILSILFCNKVGSSRIISVHVIWQWNTAGFQCKINNLTQISTLAHNWKLFWVQIQTRIKRERKNNPVKYTLWNSVFLPFPLTMFQ